MTATGDEATYATYSGTVPLERLGADVLRRHEPSIVTEGSKPATEMMRADTGLHANQTRRHVGKACLHLATRPLLTQDNCTAPIKANDVE